MKTETIIDFQNIYVNYGLTNVLKSINLKINSDENWVILGANGSGKSTLLKLFSNDKYPNAKYPYKKEIFSKERWDIFELKKLLGIITNDLHNEFAFQGAYETALNVVLSGYHSSMGVFKHHHLTEADYEKALKTMEFLEILDIKNKKVCEMSTGQLRRCIIGRSLIHDPKVFILDEPTTGLDIKAQTCFVSMLRKLAKRVPLILITHNIEEIFPEVTHAALMYNQTIYKQGKKEDILTSQNLSKIFDTNITLENVNEKYRITSKENSF